MRHLLSSILTKVGHLEAPKKETKVAGDSPAKHKYVRLDSYDPHVGEIVSCKYTQLSEVSEKIIIQGRLNSYIQCDTRRFLLWYSCPTRRFSLPLRRICAV